MINRPWHHIYWYNRVQSDSIVVRWKSQNSAQNTPMSTRCTRLGIHAAKIIDWVINKSIKNKHFGYCRSSTRCSRKSKWIEKHNKLQISWINQAIPIIHHKIQSKFVSNHCSFLSYIQSENRRKYFDQNLNMNMKKNKLEIEKDVVKFVGLFGMWRRSFHPFGVFWILTVE